MRKLGIYPRLSYAVVVVVCVVVASFLTIELAVGVAKAYGFGRKLSPNVYWLAFLFAFLIPGLKALVRLARLRPLLQVSEADLRKYALLVTVLGSLGHIFSIPVAVAYYEIAAQGREASGVGIGVALAALCYLLALWIGEFVVMRATNHVTTEPSDTAAG